MKGKKTVLYSWDEFLKDIDTLEKEAKLLDFNFKNIYGVPRGGLIIAVILSHRLNLSVILQPTKISESTLIVDDISDTGKTLKKIASKKNIVMTLFVTPHTKFEPHFACKVLKADQWVVFPFETLKSSRKDNK